MLPGNNTAVCCRSVAVGKRGGVVQENHVSDYNRAKDYSVSLAQYAGYMGHR